MSCFLVDEKWDPSGPWGKFQYLIRRVFRCILRLWKFLRMSDSISLTIKSRREKLTNALLTPRLQRPLIVIINQHRPVGTHAFFEELAPGMLLVLKRSGSFGCVLVVCFHTREGSIWKWGYVSGWKKRSDSEKSDCLKLKKSEKEKDGILE